MRHLQANKRVISTTTNAPHIAFTLLYTPSEFRVVCGIFFFSAIEHSFEFWAELASCFNHCAWWGPSALNNEQLRKQQSIILTLLLWEEIHFAVQQQCFWNWKPKGFINLKQLKHLCPCCWQMNEMREKVEGRQEGWKETWPIKHGDCIFVMTVVTVGGLSKMSKHKELSSRSNTGSHSLFFLEFCAHSYTSTVVFRSLIDFLNGSEYIITWTWTFRQYLYRQYMVLCQRRPKVPYVAT